MSNRITLPASTMRRYRPGGVADLALEQSGEIVLVGEVEVGGDLLDRPAGAVKQLLRTASFRFSRYW